jgi:hypothetical protein
MRRLTSTTIVVALLLAAGRAPGVAPGRGRAAVGAGSSIVAAGRTDPPGRCLLP